MQNKQQLIEWINDRVNHLVFVLNKADSQSAREEISIELSVIRIALEKLTAPEPVPFAWSDGDITEDYVDRITASRTGSNILPLYAAPVVLADVLPGDAIWSANPSKVNQMDDSQKVAGWKAYRAELLRRINLIESGQWKIFPTKLTADMKYAIDPCSEFSNERVQSRYDYLLAAAPEFK